jgi:hypothetical protein
MGTAKFFVHHTKQEPTDSGLAYYGKDPSYDTVKAWCESGVPVTYKTKESAAGKLYLIDVTPMPTADTVL